MKIEGIMPKDKIFNFFNLHLILWLIVVTTTLTAGSKMPAPFKVIPEPVQIEINDGSTLLYENVRAIYLKTP